MQPIEGNKLSDKSAKAIGEALRENTHVDAFYLCTKT